MAKKVKVEAVQGKYVITSDGQRLTLIGNSRQGSYVYTDGTVAYGYDNITNKTDNAPISHVLPLYPLYGTFGSRPADYIAKSGKTRGILEHKTLHGVFNKYGPAWYNDARNVYQYVETTDGSNGPISTYKTRGGSISVPGYVLRWRDDNPDVQTGEYEIPNYIPSAKYWVKETTSQGTTYKMASAHGDWPFSGLYPQEIGNVKTLSIITAGGDTIALNGQIDAILQSIDADMANRHGSATDVPGLTRPAAQRGEMRLYIAGIEDEYGWPDMYGYRRVLFDGKDALIRLKTYGYIYPSGHGYWWPVMLEYDVAYVYDTENDILTEVYFRVDRFETDDTGRVVETTKTTVEERNDGYSWAVNENYIWDSTKMLLDAAGRIVLNPCPECPVDVYESAGRLYLLYKTRIDVVSGGQIIRTDNIENDNFRLCRLGGGAGRFRPFCE